jgi:CheY-like chemotaxis protein
MDWSLKTVLIAEDEEANYMLLVEYLESTKIQIIRACNGKEAVEFCTNKLPDIILMDMKMPIMTGDEAITKIRQMNIQTPIIVQTAFRIAGEKEKILKEYCSDYVYKPFDENTLLKKMSKYIDKH